MAKAKAKSTPINWISLRDAFKRLVEVFSSPAFAESLLIEWIAEHKVRWRSKAIDGYIKIPLGATTRQAADAAQHGLWNEPDNPPRLKCDENSVFKRVDMDWMGRPRGFTVYGVDVVADHLEAQLAVLDENGAARQRSVTERWVYNRMKNDPPEKVGKDDYAGTIYSDCPDKSVGLKRIQNLVADIRKELRLPSPRKPH